MRRTPSGIPIWLLGFLLVVFVVAIQLYFYLEKQKYRQLSDALGMLQLEIESYAVHTEGSYPTDLARFLELHKIELPDNPFGAGKMKLLRPGDPWEPGGIVYVGWGPIVMMGDSENPSPIIPTDVDQYVLVAYSPRSLPGRKKAMEAAKLEFEAAQERIRRGEVDEMMSVPLYADGIDWEHVEVMLTAGEDYDSP